MLFQLVHPTTYVNPEPAGHFLHLPLASVLAEGKTWSKFGPRPGGEQIGQLPSKWVKQCFFFLPFSTFSLEIQAE